MIKYIIRDYFGEFRFGHQGQNKALYQGIYMAVCIVCMSIFLNRLLMGQSWQFVLVENALFQPVIFSYCSASVHTVRFGKMMYLCPMDCTERRHYIYGAYCFRVGVHLLVSIIGLYIVCINSWCDWISVIQILQNDLMAALLISHSQRAEVRSRGKIAGEMLFLLAVVSCAIQFGIVTDVGPNLWVKLVVFIVFVLVELPLEIWYLKYVRGELQAAVYYESCAAVALEEC